MTTSIWIRTYAVSLAAFLVLDFLWLGLVARGKLFLFGLYCMLLGLLAWFLLAGSAA